MGPWFSRPDLFLHLSSLVRKSWFPTCITDAKATGTKKGIQKPIVIVSDIPNRLSGLKVNWAMNQSLYTFIVIIQCYSLGQLFEREIWEIVRCKYFKTRCFNSVRNISRRTAGTAVPPPPNTCLMEKGRREKGKNSLYLPKSTMTGVLWLVGAANSYWFQDAQRPFRPK